MQAIGLDLYVKLLEQAILELRGEEPRERPRAALNLRLELRVPPDYVPETHQRLSIYKRVSQLASAPEVEALRAELRDRYGPLPPEVAGLLRFAELRLRAEALAISEANLAGGTLVLRFDARTPLSPDALVRLVKQQPGAAILPDGLRWPLAGPGRAAGSRGAARPPARGPIIAAACPADSPSCCSRSRRSRCSARRLPGARTRPCSSSRARP